VQVTDVTFPGRKMCGDARDPLPNRACILFELLVIGSKAPCRKPPLSHSPLPRRARPEPRQVGPLA
jgi:hypothetical protein